MKIIVSIKQVPDTSGKVAVNPDGTLNRASMQTITNPDDMNALEAALKIKDATGCKVIVVTMGPAPAAGMLREALAMGADEAILVSAREFGGSDTYATSQILAAAISTIGVESDDIVNLPPILRLEKLNKYTFNTPNDGGTGAQYRGLINFDLANMLAAPIPFVVHDSILLKNIDKPVFSEIVRVYEKQKEHGKQVFLVYDTLASYDAGAQRILEKNAVLRLSPAGNELFGWAWNKEEKNDADETS